MQKGAGYYYPENKPLQPVPQDVEFNDGPPVSSNSSIEYAAIVAHEANRVLCAALGDFSQPIGSKAPGWQIESAKNGVLAILADPGMTPEQSHESWSKQKIADGWVWGPVKNVEKKEHPCLVPYAALPYEQRLKDILFGIVVRGVLGLQQMQIPTANEVPSAADLDAAAAEQVAKEATAGHVGILAGTTPPADAPHIDISVDKIPGTVAVNGDPERPKAEGEPAAESEPSLGGTEPA